MVMFEPWADGSSVVDLDRLRFSTTWSRKWSPEMGPWVRRMEKHEETWSNRWKMMATKFRGCLSLTFDPWNDIRPAFGLLFKTSRYQGVSLCGCIMKSYNSWSTNIAFWACNVLQCTARHLKQTSQCTSPRNPRWWPWEWETPSCGSPAKLTSSRYEQQCERKRKWQRHAKLDLHRKKLWRVPFMGMPKWMVDSGKSHLDDFRWMMTGVPLFQESLHFASVLFKIGSIACSVLAVLQLILSPSRRGRPGLVAPGHSSRVGQ